MYTHQNNRTKRIERDWEYRLSQEMRLLNFSSKTIKLYLYYNKELLRFASKIPLGTEAVVNYVETVSISRSEHLNSWYICGIGIALIPREYEQDTE